MQKESMLEKPAPQFFRGTLGVASIAIVLFTIIAPLPIKFEQQRSPARNIRYVSNIYKAQHGGGEGNPGQPQERPETVHSSTPERPTLQWRYLNRPSATQGRALPGHSDFVSSVAFSPDGKTLATGSSDNTVKLWSVDTGKILRTLTGHTSPVYTMAFSPDGKILATGSDDNTVKLWRVAEGTELQTLTEPRSSVYAADEVSTEVINILTNLNSIAFSPDGKILATGSLDNTVKLWSVASGRILRTMTGHANFVCSVAFSPDGKTLATGSYKTVKLWSVASGRILRTITGHASFVCSVAFSPDGKMLATGSCKTLKLWSLADGKVLRTLNGHTSFVCSMAFSPDSKALATGSYKMVKLWNVADGHALRTLTGNTRAVFAVAFSPDGKRLAMSSEDAKAKLWNRGVEDALSLVAE